MVDCLCVRSVKTVSLLTGLLKKNWVKCRCHRKLVILPFPQRPDIFVANPNIFREPVKTGLATTWCVLGQRIRFRRQRHNLCRQHFFRPSKGNCSLFRRIRRPLKPSPRSRRCPQIRPLRPRFEDSILNFAEIKIKHSILKLTAF